MIEAFVAGATDYLTKPIKPTLVRSRVRGWLMRTV
jgi:DNA-binding response OmpR family regulator